MWISGHNSEIQKTTKFMKTHGGGQKTMASRMSANKKES